MTMRFIDYEVCQDCLLYIAYDDINHEDETAESMRNHVAREIGDKDASFAVGYHTRVYQVTGYDAEGFRVDEIIEADCEETAIKEAISDNGLPEEDSEYSCTEITEMYETDEFSWHECDLCKSSLGGSRHAATLILR